jgi:hypothetical protein
MDGSCSDDSEIENERAGGGPGPTSGGPEQEDRGRIRADDVYPECWRSIHYSVESVMTAETLCVRADIACVFYICIWAVTTTRSGIDSF